MGRIIATEAAKHIKPCVLELGGKAPAIVMFPVDFFSFHLLNSWLKILNDADITDAAKAVVFGAMFNSGQASCIIESNIIIFF